MSALLVKSIKKSISGVKQTCLSSVLNKNSHLIQETTEISCVIHTVLADIFYFLSSNFSFKSHSELLKTEFLKTTQTNRKAWD